MAVPIREELIASVRDGDYRLMQSMQRLLSQFAERVKGLARGLPSPIQALEFSAQRLDDWAERLALSLPQLLQTKIRTLQTLIAGLSPSSIAIRLRHQVDQLSSLRDRHYRAMLQVQEKREQKLAALGQVLASLNYENVLKRGFAMVKDSSGNPVTRTAKLLHGQEYDLVMQDGTRKIRAD